MKKKTKVIIALSVVLVVVAVCLAVFLKPGTGTLTGQWKSDKGDVLSLNKDGTYWWEGDGYKSEQGRYETRIAMAKNNKTVNSIGFHVLNRFIDPYFYCYELDGNTLRISYDVTENGQLIDEYLRTYKKIIEY